MNTRISIDNLIEIVRTGGKVKTGVDVYNEKGTLLLDKNVLVEKTKILEIIKASGIHSVPVNTSLNGGMWDDNGNLIQVDSGGFVDQAAEGRDKAAAAKPPEPVAVKPDPSINEIENRLQEIEQVKKEAVQKFTRAKQTVKKVLTDIRETGGEFDYNEVQKSVSDLVDFMDVKDNPFAFLTQEILSYDDYLYNHCVHVCTIGTAIVNRFNAHFSGVVDDLLKSSASDIFNPFERQETGKQSTYTCYYEEDLKDISLGFFLHDIGKVVVADEVLNKEGRLTDKEFEEVKRHSYEYGIQVIDKNRLKNSVIRNIIKYHHAPLYAGEPRCYPDDISHVDVPLYTRICKLADIYDAMTSKRCYKEAINPITVVTRLFRDYAKKDHMLQYILHSFVKSIGIYPPGSIIYLRNGQMAYVLESTGPLVLPFTDGQRNTLTSRPDPLDLSKPGIDPDQLIEGRRSVKKPGEVYDQLPSFIREILN